MTRLLPAMLSQRSSSSFETLIYGPGFAALLLDWHDDTPRACHCVPYTAAPESEGESQRTPADYADATLRGQTLNCDYLHIAHRLRPAPNAAPLADPFPVRRFSGAHGSGDLPDSAAAFAPYLTLKSYQTGHMRHQFRMDLQRQGLRNPRYVTVRGKPILENTCHEHLYYCIAALVRARPAHAAGATLASPTLRAATWALQGALRELHRKGRIALELATLDDLDDDATLALALPALEQAILSALREHLYDDEWLTDTALAALCQTPLNMLVYHINERSGVAWSSAREQTSRFDVMPIGAGGARIKLLFDQWELEHGVFFEHGQIEQLDAAHSFFSSTAEIEVGHARLDLLWYRAALRVMPVCSAQP